MGENLWRVVSPVKDAYKGQLSWIGLDQVTVAHNWLLLSLGQALRSFLCSREVICSTPYQRRATTRNEMPVECCSTSQVPSIIFTPSASFIETSSQRTSWSVSQSISQPVIQSVSQSLSQSVSLSRWGVSVTRLSASQLFSYMYNLSQYCFMKANSHVLTNTWLDSLRSFTSYLICIVYHYLLLPNRPLLLKTAPAIKPNRNSLDCCACLSPMLMLACL